MDSENILHPAHLLIDRSCLFFLAGAVWTLRERLKTHLRHCQCFASSYADTFATKEDCTFAHTLYLSPSLFLVQPIPFKEN